MDSVQRAHLSANEQKDGERGPQNATKSSGMGATMRGDAPDMTLTSRGYHQSLAEWRKTLPSPGPDFPNRVLLPAAIDDLNEGLIGKSALFFNIGSVMYEFYRSNQVHGRLRGYGRLLFPEFAGLIALLDDAQGITFGKAAMTKSLRLQFPGPFDLKAYMNRVNLETRAEIIPNGDRIDIFSNVFVFDTDGKLIAYSETHFVQNEKIRKLQDRPGMSDAEFEAQKDRTWQNLRPYWLTPDLTWRDAGKFNLALRLDQHEPSIPYPSFWKPLEGANSVKPRESVMKSSLSAEGPSAFTHGGCLGGSWLYILSHAVDIGTLRSFTVHFKKPVALGSIVSCEWVRSGACDWRGTVRDTKGDLLQELYAECAVGNTSSTHKAAL